jgi:TM2 domain-containing membrane protein YozV
METKMNTFVTRILGIGLLTLVSGAGALYAGQQAKFHLPVKATWGGIVLQPGDYSLSLPEVAISNYQFWLRGEGKNVLIPAMSAGYNYPGYGRDDHSELTLTNVDGTFYIESYKSGPSSKEFNFYVPSAKHRMRVGKREVTKVDVSGE